MSDTLDISNLDFLTDNGIYLPMINDTGRNMFYKTMIEKYCPGKVVVDIGAGSGFLSIIAAEAGATKVYAVEGDPGRFQFLTNIINKLGLQDKIEPLLGDFLTLDIKGDIYVSETFGWHIFNENILNIADHARQLGGQFAPGVVKVWAEVYTNHPIFSVLQANSEAHDFQPDIDMNPAFHNIISGSVANNHPAVKTKANCLPNFFNLYKSNNDMKQIQIDKIYTSNVLEIDFNQPKINEDQLFLTIPPGVINTSNLVAIFWSTSFGDVEMQVTDTWWSTPVKVIHSAPNGVEIRYQPAQSFVLGASESQSSWYFYT